jgi:mono/diheme cytochrome c family protein
MTEYTKRIAFISLALVLIKFVLIEAADSSPLRDRSATPSRVNVEELFRDNCARCHGSDGRGDTPLGRTYNTPDFSDAEWWQKHSSITGKSSLAAIVSQGKGGMPAFGKKLRRSEINLLVKYVRRFRNQAGTSRIR